MSRRQEDFRRQYSDHANLKFKFIFSALGASDTPIFKKGGFAILSQHAPSSWKALAIQQCGVNHTHFATGTDRVHAAMLAVIGCAVKELSVAA